MVFLLGGTTQVLAHGDLDERIERLTHELDKDGSRSELWLERADLHRQHADFSKAMADANEAVRLRPDWSSAYLQRARILIDQQEYVSARSAANECLERDPGDPDARVIRARCHAHLGQTNAAIQDLDAVLSGEHPPLPDLYLERARLQAGLGQLSIAVRGLDEGMARLGESPSLALPAFDYQRQLGGISATLSRLETLRRFMPPESLLALKGEVLLEAGRRAEASKVFQEALERLVNSGLPRPRPHRDQTELQARLLAGLEKAAGTAITAKSQPIDNP